MRIENNLKIGGNAASRTSKGASSGASFSVGESVPASRPATSYAAAPAGPLDALLALQAVDTATEGRRRQMRRGRSLLDAMDAMKADLLAGRLSEGNLNQLMALIGLARERTDPELDGLLDEIELRARVELAKRGRFPAF